DIRIYSTGNGLKLKEDNFLLPFKDDLFLIDAETGMQLYNITNGRLSSVSSQHNLFYKGFVQNSRPVLFYSNNNGFGKYDPVNRRIVDSILPGPPITEVYCSVMDANGIIFNGTHRGLFIRAGKKYYYYDK